MVALGILLALLSVVGLVGYQLLRSKHEGKLEKMRVNSERKVASGDLSQTDADRIINAERFPIPAWANKTLLGTLALGIVLAVFNGLVFYAEPTFKYHIRPIWGGEKVVMNKTGYSIKGWGRVNDWKNAMTVQASGRGLIDADGDGIPDVSAAESDTSISAKLGTQTVIFLDQVDAQVSATVRYKLPEDETKFKLLIHDYRTPENFLQTELIPAFLETLKATGSLMSAEEYFSGGRTEFIGAFEDQMQFGVYKVKRIQVVGKAVGTKRSKTADASAAKQEAYDDEDGKVVFKVEKLTAADGTLLRKEQNFDDYGVSVVSARITNLVPNTDFQNRMKAKQEASAQRSVNREKRIEEEEKKFFAIAKGEREVAEAQAAAKKEQITKTTNEETTKRLALIKAARMKEEAAIAKETAQINLEKAELDAQRQERLAEADKFERESRIAGDNALQQRLDAWVTAQQAWAEAFANRKVPATVFGTGGNGGAGTDSDVQAFMNIMTMKAANDLQVDTTIGDAAAARQ